MASSGVIFGPNSSESAERSQATMKPPPMSEGWTPWIFGAPTLEVTGIRAFIPPNASDTSQDLFVARLARSSGFPTAEQHAACPGLDWHRPYYRNMRKSDPSELLVYTDGSCLDNGRDGAAAGCAFVYHDFQSENNTGTCSFRLEDEGPDEHVAPQTSNRAELRAVIGALQFRLWAGEGFARVVIATDSEYVALGATNWVHGWKWNGWKTSDGKALVKNRDLWEELLQLVGRHNGMRCEVLFWRIPRALNQVADQAAKKAALWPSTEKYCFIQGVMC